MEQNLPVLMKKVWNLVRVVYFKLRKGICKRKLLLDLSLMVKRGKIAGKALQNLMFSHHNWAALSVNHRPHNSFPSPPPSEYEFRPVTGNHSFFLFSKKHPSNYKTAVDLDMIDVNASPVLHGFGRIPLVRVTDSPFPLNRGDEDGHVDEAAEQFISRFYNDLRRQNTKAGFGSS